MATIDEANRLHEICFAAEGDRDSTHDVRRLARDERQRLHVAMEFWRRYRTPDQLRAQAKKLAAGDPDAREWEEINEIDRMAEEKEDRLAAAVRSAERFVRASLGDF